MTNNSAAERANFVDEIMQREREEASRVPAEPPRRSRGRSLFVLLPVLVGLTTWNVLTMTRATRSPAPPIESEAARLTLYVVAQAVDEYRDSSGVLPTTLSHVGFGDEGIEYARLDGSYTLTANIGANRIVYRAGEDLAEYWVANQASLQEDQ